MKYPLPEGCCAESDGPMWTALIGRPAELAVTVTTDERRQWPLAPQQKLAR